jgi:mannose-1-phosphate guanylyltransferase/mannose-6-phosphate isomerase
MTTESTVVPLILSGGFGTRLWPASRKRQPKQMLPLVDERTMFRATMDRVATIPGVTTPFVIANVDQQAAIQRQLAAAGIEDADIVLEPIGRNTAPAVAVAALELLSRGRDPLLLVLPADHVIRNEETFGEAVQLATWFAERNHLVTFGISPTHPETGYGYIQFGKPLAEGVREVKEFKEKPDRRTAEEYVVSGRYLWNSGMFLFKASTYLDELGRFNPEIVTAAKAALDGAERSGSMITLDGGAFAESPADSIDYAVMEHTEDAAVVPIHAGWSDVGSWSALYDLTEHDDQGNTLIGDVETIDVANSYIRGGDRLIAAIGVDGLVIVDTRDALLVTRRDRSQDVRDIVERIRAAGRPEFESDGTEQRPWGWFATLDAAPQHRVLRLHVEPHGKTSVQTHHDRSEYWIVTKGEATITIGENTRVVTAPDVVFLPAGERHRLENATEVPVEVVEVDLGSDGSRDQAQRPGEGGEPPETRR